VKPIYPNDLPPADDLSLSFDSVHDPSVPLERELEPVLQGLESYAGDWMPELTFGKQQHKYSRAAVVRAFDEGREEGKTIIGLYRTKLPAMDGWLELGPERYRVYFRLKPLSLFETEDRSRSVVNVVRAWAEHLPVKYASATAGIEGELGIVHPYNQERWWSGDEPEKIYDVYWLNVFGPRLVETVGRQRMLSTPAHLVEELPGGAVLIVTWPIAAEFARDEARQAQARALTHLRPDLDYDSVLRTLRERSAALVPVEPNFHPDIAPLLSRMVEDHWPSLRYTTTAELNAYRPPEPEEWLPADAAPPSDVPDREAAVGRIGYVAEHLVALLHNEVPGIFQETPGSLTDIDFIFWREDWPSNRDRKALDQALVPPIGAYLGEVLVRNLGGEWVPRKKLEESQVRVGNRAWLPFVRAWRYMRTNQSLMDYSLTQLYRAAERHRRGGAAPELSAENAVAKAGPDEQGYLARERAEREARGKNWEARHVADLLGFSELTVKRMARRGKIPAVKIGRSWEFPPERVRAWAQQEMPQMGIAGRGGRGT
jgi:excisionase family DNA binding protein